MSIAIADVGQSYKLRQGDLIQVSVWGEDKLQKESLDSVPAIKAVLLLK